MLQIYEWRLTLFTRTLSIFLTLYIWSDAYYFVIKKSICPLISFFVVFLRSKEKRTISFLDKSVSGWVWVVCSMGEILSVKLWVQEKLHYIGVLIYKVWLIESWALLPLYCAFMLQDRYSNNHFPQVPVVYMFWISYTTLYACFGNLHKRSLFFSVLRILWREYLLFRYAYYD